MNEAKYTVTLKGDSIHDPWLIIKTDTARDMAEALELTHAWELPVKIAVASDRMRRAVSDE